jgi:hypothetical protein
MALDGLANSTNRIDQQVLLQFDQQRHYWTEVLKRVVACVQFLAERGLSFRGNDERLGSANNGNFLGIMELMSKFDPFLASHLARYGSGGGGVVSYLSKTTQDEFILLMVEKVQREIKKELHDAKYYALIVDSTPDVAKVDQLTVVYRYVNQVGVAVERFVKFQPISGHDAATLENAVLQTVADMELSISNCRGQSYDNATNMSGVYSGLQARIKSLNALADFVPCYNHSLNLVGTSAAECCIDAVSFFGFGQ